MLKYAVSDARKDLADTLNRVRYEGVRILLHRRGKKLAAIVPVEDLEILDALEERIDLAEAKVALREAKKKGTIRWDDLKKEIGI